MAQPTSEGVLDRLLAPRLFLLGTVLSFLGCCVAGACLSQRNPFRDFLRFHTFISPESLYYPTASQVLALARQALQPDKVAVVVGGNSITQGVGQRSCQLWTVKLQSDLGDDYQVLNLAMRGAYPAEVGGTTAEALQGERKRLIFVTVLGPGAVGDPDGEVYRYFFWGAYYKGLLPLVPAREGRLRALEQARRGGKFIELKRGARLDGCLYFNDLWNALAYRRCSTVWVPAVSDSFTRPRKRYADIDPGPATPLEVRYRPSQQAVFVQHLRALAHQGRGAILGPVPISPDGSPMVLALRDCFPPPCRRRTLLLLAHYGPSCVQQLSPQERADYRALFPDMARLLQAEGYATLELGRDYSPDDYFDPVHISEKGAVRMAREVADKVRQMAEGLGYARGGPGP